MEINCFICDRFDDVAVEISSLDDTAKYLLSVLTEIECDLTDVLCFGCNGKLTISTSFLKMCRTSQRCLERKQQQLKEESFILEQDNTIEERRETEYEIFVQEIDDTEVIEEVPEEPIQNVTKQEVTEEREKTTINESISENTTPGELFEITIETHSDNETQQEYKSFPKRDIYTDAEYDDLTCEYCFDKFNNSDERKVHELNHETEGRPYRCYVCSQQFRTRQTLRCHYESHMNLTWTCSYEGCSKTFKTKHGKWTHEYKHKNEMKPCPECGKYLKTTWAVNQHIKQMHTELPRVHSCPKCDKKFKSHKDLYNHSIIHDENKRSHECKTCHKRFFRRTKLVQHENQVHSGKKV